MTSQRISAVLFDLDDTLHDDTTTYRSAAQRVADGIARERRIDADALFQAYIGFADGFWAELRDEHLTLSLKGLRERMWGDALASVGVRDDVLARHAAAEYNRHRATGLRLFPEVLPFLDRLRAAGVRTGLITNGFAETHREKITLLRLENAFDAVILADEVGMVKPDPRIFLHACERMGAPPEETVMVGDRYDRDIAGALAAGLKTIWLNVRGEELPVGVPPPHVTVSSFPDVCRILDRAVAGVRATPA